MFALADAHGCELIGGDTTAGPLNICITIFGEVLVASGQSMALLRSGARAGNDLYVSGTVGDARLALDALQGRIELPEEVLRNARLKLEMPTPRVALGMALRGLATSAIDVSDGLLGDLDHVLKASGVGATVRTEDAIASIASHAYCKRSGGLFSLNLSHVQWLALALAGGDDYELLFTAPGDRRAEVDAAALASQTPVHRIGQIDAQAGLRLLGAQGEAVTNTFTSFDHFA
jgi:thiamine-monophosphate kinase